jgi:hypothetical protein
LSFSLFLARFCFAGDPKGYHETRAAAAAITPNEHSELGPRWQEFKKAMTVSLANLLEFYPDSEIVFLARDAEFFYELALALGVSPEKIKLINVSRKSQAAPNLFEYLTEQGLGVERLRKNPNLKIVFFDSGWRGLLQQAIIDLYPEDLQDRFKSDFLFSSNPSIASTRTFLRGFVGEDTEMLTKQRPSIKWRMAVEFENLAHLTATATHYKRNAAGALDAYSESNPNPEQVRNAMELLASLREWGKRKQTQNEFNLQRKRLRNLFNILEDSKTLDNGVVSFENDSFRFGDPAIQTKSVHSDIEKAFIYGDDFLLEDTLADLAERLPKGSTKAKEKLEALRRQVSPSYFGEGDVYDQSQQEKSAQQIKNTNIQRYPDFAKYIRDPHSEILPLLKARDFSVLKKMLEAGVWDNELTSFLGAYLALDGELLEKFLAEFLSWEYFSKLAPVRWHALLSCFWNPATHIPTQNALEEFVKKVFSLNKETELRKMAQLLNATRTVLLGVSHLAPPTWAKSELRYLINQRDYPRNQADVSNVVRLYRVLALNTLKEASDDDQFSFLRVVEKRILDGISNIINGFAEGPNLNTKRFPIAKTIEEIFEFSDISNPQHVENIVATLRFLKRVIAVHNFGDSETLETTQNYYRVLKVLIFSLEKYQKHPEIVKGLYDLLFLSQSELVEFPNGFPNRLRRFKRSSLTTLRSFFFSTLERHKLDPLLSEPEMEQMKIFAPRADPKTEISSGELRVAESAPSPGSPVEKSKLEIDLFNSHPKIKQAIADSQWEALAQELTANLYRSPSDKSALATELWTQAELEQLRKIITGNSELHEKLVGRYTNAPILPSPDAKTRIRYGHHFGEFDFFLIHVLQKTDQEKIFEIIRNGSEREVYRTQLRYFKGRGADVHRFSQEAATKIWAELFSTTDLRLILMPDLLVQVLSKDSNLLEFEKHIHASKGTIRQTAILANLRVAIDHLQKPSNSNAEYHNVKGVFSIIKMIVLFGEPDAYKMFLTTNFGNLRKMQAAGENTIFYSSYLKFVDMALTNPRTNGRSLSYSGIFNVWTNIHQFFSKAIEGLDEDYRKHAFITFLEILSFDYENIFQKKPSQFEAQLAFRILTQSLTTKSGQILFSQKLKLLGEKATFDDLINDFNLYLHEEDRPAKGAAISHSRVLDVLLEDSFWQETPHERMHLARAVFHSPGYIAEKRVKEVTRAESEIQKFKTFEDWLQRMSKQKSQPQGSALDCADLLKLFFKA